MKHTTGPRRGRPRGNGKRFSSGKNQTFESSGPEVKIRGTAQQVHEKYLSLARDALSAGDRISAEGYFQFADHYYRIVTAANGNGQARSDRNANIPPPPESVTGQVGSDEGAAANAGGGGMNVGDADTPTPSEPAEQSASEERNDAPQRQRQGNGRGRRRTKPAVSQESDGTSVDGESFAAEVQGAEPAAQAEELAQALSRADAPVAPAPQEPAPQENDAEGEGAPKRRRRSPLGIARKRPAGRPRKVDDAVAAVSEENPENSGVVKTVRRGARKAEPKPEDTATENA